MFRKPRRAYRGSRKDESDGDTEELLLDGIDSIQSSGCKMALSFGDDLEEPETFKVKRPAHSRRVLKQLKEGKSSLKSVVSDSSSVPKDLPVGSTQPYPSSLEEVLVTSDVTHNDEIVRVKPLNRTYSEQFSSLLKRGVIPDASTIHMVRKQRQKAKFQLEAEESPSSPYASNNDGRRLIREEDDDEEEDYSSVDTSIYHRRRPAFTLTAEYRDPSSRRRVDISRGLQHRREQEHEDDKGRRSMIEAVENESKNKNEDEGDSEYNDEEDDTWERQQIQKAVSFKNTAVLEALEPLSHTDGGLLPKPSCCLADFGDVTLPSIKAILQERLDKKQKTMQENKVELLKSKADLNLGYDTISASRTKLPELASTLTFYMNLREFARDVISCLNEKMQKIEYMEKRSISLYRERADTLMARRRIDVGDMADEAAGPTCSGDIAVDKTTRETRKRRKADREARRTRRRRERKPDELHDKRIEAIIGIPPPFDGVSSDDEEPQAVIAKRTADFDDIKKDTDHLFDDVVEEYCTISAILHRFCEWRERVVESYAQAYIPLCLAQLLTPLIRLQMLTWNPLEANCPFFDDYAWFGCFLDYFADLQRVEDLETDATKEADAQRKILHSLATSPDHELALIPLVIEKVLLPRLTEIVSASWDPISWCQTQRLVNVIRSFATLWPTVSAESKATQLLFEAVLQRMEYTIQMDIFIPLYSKQIMSDPQNFSRLFFDRQLNTSIKLLSNILEWRDLLAPAALKHLTFTCLVNRYILIGLASLMSTAVSNPSDGDVFEQVGDLAVWKVVVKRLEAIVLPLPPDWLIETESSQLTQLRRFVSQLIERMASCDTVGGLETKEATELRLILKDLKQIQSHLFAKSSL